MRVSQDLNSYITLKDEYGEIANSMIFLFAKSGHGKTMAMDSIIEEYHRAGYVVLILSDVKKEFEFAYSMFEPEKKYHLDFLRRIGKPIASKPVKIYHPFTFRVPKYEKYPDINFYGFSLKDMNREEWSMIAESFSESDTVRLLCNISSTLDKSDGLYSFLHKMRDAVKGKAVKTKSMSEYSKDNFYLDTNLATAKSLQDVASYFMPFKQDYFLVPDNSKLKLDWKEILNDNTHYHFFTDYWIDDRKLESLCIATLFNQIMKNSRLTKKQLLIVIPEIRRLVPDKQAGYQTFLATVIKDNLTIMRSKGRGMSGIFDSQVWSDLHESVRSSATEVLYGELNGRDVELLSKGKQYGKNEKKLLNRMPYKGTYLMQGEEGRDTFTTWLPGHMHKEEKYNFFEMYAKHFSDKLKNYKDLHDEMKQQLIDEENVVKVKIEKRIRDQKKLIEQKEKAKQESLNSSNTIEKVKDKTKAYKNEALEAKQKAVYLFKLDNPDLTWREIGRRLDMDNKTAKKYYEQYSDRLSKQQILVEEKPEEENLEQDFEQKFIEED